MGKNQEKDFSTINPVNKKHVITDRFKKATETKCVVWDLDNTIWNGILLESDNVELKNGIPEILKTLDSRGILNSIASKNNYDDAMNKLKEFELDHFFLYPEINWNAKSSSIERIQKNLNIGLDTFMFVDDQSFERDEVHSRLPQVVCADATDYASFLKLPNLNPRFATKDSSRRREMYLEDQQRKKIEQDFKGPNEAFLKSLDLSFIISEAKEEDLKRAEELTIRTNQLNSTGITYDYDELKSFMNDDDYILLCCELTDKYGSYGKIGISLIEITELFYHVKILLMSCRVMSRGVGSVLINYIMKEAKRNGKKLKADFRKTDRNRMMFITYKFAGFREATEDGVNFVLLHDLEKVQPYPPYLKITIK